MKSLRAIIADIREERAHSYYAAGYTIEMQMLLTGRKVEAETIPVDYLHMFELGKTAARSQLQNAVEHIVPTLLHATRPIMKVSSYDLGWNSCILKIRELIKGKLDGNAS